MVTSAEVARLRLVAQRVVAPAGAAPTTPLDVVTHLTAVQAQDEPGAVTSIALRIPGGTRDDVLAAYDRGEIVRSWPMRGTLHTVAAVDLAWMVATMTARPRAAAATRRVDLGLSDADVVRARDLLTTALAGGRSLPRAEALAVWSDAGLATTGGRGYHLLAELAHQGVVCFGPRAGKEHLLVLLEEWVPAPRVLEREEAIAELARRFLRGHGPATVADLARWTGLGLREVRAGIAAGAADLERIDVDGTEHLLDPEVPALLDACRDAVAGVVLLPGFDEIVLGYADRTATVPAAHADRIVPGANGVFRPTVLHDGVAVATWRWVGTGRNRRVEATPFTTLDDDVAAAVPVLAAALP